MRWSYGTFGVIFKEWGDVKEAGQFWEKSRDLYKNILFIGDVYLFLVRDFPENKNNSIPLGTPYGGATSACGG